MKKIPNAVIYLFVAFCLLCLLVIIFYTANNTLKRGQDRIIGAYERQIQRNDSIRNAEKEEWNKIMIEKEFAIERMLADSAIDSIPSLCPKQKAAVKKFIVPCWKETIREFEHKERTNPETKVTNEDEIKALLQLEFNKIQNEYETLSIWCAIMTILFLIFSFYSLFKTEKFEIEAQKAKEVFERDSKKVIDKMTQKNNIVVSNAQKEIDRCNTLIDDFEGRFNDLLKLYDAKITILNNEQDEEIK